MFLWPALPVELKRLILELIARDDVHNARSLRLVSRDINVLVLPIIFHHVVVENIADLITVTRTITPPVSPVYRLRNKRPEPPRVLSSYNTASLALLLPETLPSIENALAGVGAIFSRIGCLAITSRNLSSNAFWLRENRVRPNRIMLLHHGSPRPINWRDRIFSKTTHIFTSSLDSHGPSTLSDLSNLTHIAVSTHSEITDDKIRCIATKLQWLLDPGSLPTLEALVLGLERFPLPPLEHVCGHIIIDYSARERYTTLLSRWRTHLNLCLASPKFFILPQPLYPRDEWERWIYSDSPDIWQQALSYRENHPNSVVFDPRPPEVEHQMDQWLSMIEVDLLHTEDDPPLTPEKQNAHSHLFSRVDWEIDLIEREGYRQSERLDPGEAGEFVHMLGL